MQLSYVTANLIAQPANFSGEHDWDKLHDAMVQGTSPESFRRIAKAVKKMGFEGIEIYTGHCDPYQRDADYAKAIRDVCAAERLPIVAYAGGAGYPGATRQEFARHFAMCKALGCTLMAGTLAGKDWTLPAKMLRDEGLILAYENHPEKTAEEVLAKVEPFSDVIKVNLDTGNLTAQGGDARVAAEKLFPLIVHLHLKDVRAVGGHDTLALGKGVARVKDALEYVLSGGYAGWASIEHEPFDRDPDPEVAESVKTVRKWLARK